MSNEQSNKLLFAVNLWGSHPDCENSDCWTGVAFATLAEAEAVYSASDPVRAMADLSSSSQYFQQYYYDSTTHVELDGPGVNKVREVRVTKRSRSGDVEWCRECAIQAGMVFGCLGYNDEMAY